ncbi:hypothetical protein CAEBREN_18413 [Caenorhabditis brenneri]|uniref:Uncharacterized protein n=1 Tax=Caenorhabditis brenneri TaxID=135651 RepID=G0MDA7_CAEBE|nr:hypothetical protein CAEBREN_18413 [Caenorhabditis brenneri]
MSKTSGSKMIITATIAESTFFSPSPSPPEEQQKSTVELLQMTKAKQLQNQKACGTGDRLRYLQLNNLRKALVPTYAKVAAKSTKTPTATTATDNAVKEKIVADRFLAKYPPAKKTVHPEPKSRKRQATKELSPLVTAPIYTGWRKLDVSILRQILIEIEMENEEEGKEMLIPFKDVY